MRHVMALMIVLLGAVIAVAPVATAMAQPGGSPAAPQTAPANPSGMPGADAAPPTPPAGGDARADDPPVQAMPERPSETPAPRNEAATSSAAPSDDTLGASPRTGDTDATRVVGRPMLAALLIAGALLFALMLIVGFSRMPSPEPRYRRRYRPR
jgi:hypothetical protein